MCRKIQCAMRMASRSEHQRRLERFVAARSFQCAVRCYQARQVLRQLEVEHAKMLARMATRIQTYARRKLAYKAAKRERKRDPPNCKAWPPLKKWLPRYGTDLQYGTALRRISYRIFSSVMASPGYELDALRA